MEPVFEQGSEARKAIAEPEAERDEPLGEAAFLGRPAVEEIVGRRLGRGLSVEGPSLEPAMDDVAEGALRGDRSAKPG